MKSTSVSRVCCASLQSLAQVVLVMWVNGDVHIFPGEKRRAVQCAVGHRGDDPACNFRAAGHQICTLDLF